MNAAPQPELPRGESTASSNSVSRIVIEKLSKRFGQLMAVRDLSLEVRAGEIVGFLGPNGAGKTTTIRMLMGFISPTAGRCRVFGGSLRAEPALRRHVGYRPGDSGMLGLLP